VGNNGSLHIPFSLIYCLLTAPDPFSRVSFTICTYSSWERCKVYKIGFFFLFLVPSQINNKLPEMNNLKEATPAIAIAAIPDSNHDIEIGGPSGLVAHHSGQVTIYCCCNTK
jgi:hypothetical protein